MKKLLTILLTLFLFSSAYAEVRVVDKLEYRDGIAYAVGEGEGFSGAYITKHSNGSKESEVNYIDGKRDGLTTKWFNNGNKSSEYLFKLGQRATIIKVNNNNIEDIVAQEIYNFGNNVNLNHLDTSEVTDMSEIFYHSRFSGDISKWDVSKVTDMSFMFYGSWFNGNISKWDVSNVTDMKKMFSGYLFPNKKGPKPQKIRQSRFNGDISKWDVSNVTDMSGIFKYSKFNGDISKWNISNVANTGLTLYGSKFTGDRLKRSMTLIEAEGDSIVIEEIEIRGGIAYAVGESESFSGKLVTTYSNGKKETEINYKNGKQEGLDTWWYKNGKKGRESRYKNNQLDGLEIEWDGGSVVSTINWQKGKKHGLETKRFVDSTIEAKINWRDGKKHGLDTWWFNSRAWGEQGKKRSETNWVDDLKNGISITYRKNGTKQSEIKYLNDKEIDKEYFQDKFAVQKQKSREVLRKKRTQERWANKYKINFVDKKVVSIIPKLPKLLQPSKHSSMFVHTMQNKESAEEAELFFYIGQLLIGELSNGLKHNKELGYVYLERAAYLGIVEAFYPLITKEEKLLESNQEYKNASDKARTDLNKENLARLVTITKQHSPALYQLKKREALLHQMVFTMSGLFGSYKEKLIKKMMLEWSDATTEAFLMLRGHPYNAYISPKDIVIKNLEDEARKPSTFAIMMLIQMYSRPRDIGGEIPVAKDDKKAEYWARFAISENIHELRKSALKVLRALDVKDFREIIKYTDAIKGIAKNFVMKELEASSKYCTVAFLKPGSKKKHVYSYGKVKSCFEKVKVELCLEKMDVYRYNKVDLCLEKIKEADEKGNLDKGYFKNGNNSLIFWGPLGGYEGTKRLMKDHKPLNK